LAWFLKDTSDNNIGRNDLNGNRVVVRTNTFSVQSLAASVRQWQQQLHQRQWRQKQHQTRDSSRLGSKLFEIACFHSESVT